MYDIDLLVANTKKLKLLFVEDNADARESTLLILNDLFDNIIVAVDGADGLEKYKQNQDIDLVLSDINMPNMNGIEMCKAIKEIKPDQSIIILTALIDIVTIKDAIDIGIDGFINKPLEDIDILFAKIDQIVKKINYDLQQKELEQARLNQEKIELVMKLIQNISHHWKQPLSVIAAISSGLSFKIENKMPLSEEDYKSTDIITSKIQELSSVFNRLESLQLNNVTLEDIEKILYISNPIYKDK